MSIIRKIYILSLVIIVSLIASCNTPDTNTPSRKLVLSVNSPTGFQVIFFVGRNGSQQVDHYVENNATSPFSYTSTLAHVGDGIGITITGNTKQPFTASLTSAGADIPSTGSGFSPASGNYFIIWNAVVPN